MRWKRGSSACAGFANRPRGPVVAHSKPPRPSETEKLMSAACEATPSSPSMRSKLG